MKCHIKHVVGNQNDIYRQKQLQTSTLITTKNVHSFYISHALKKTTGISSRYRFII